MAEGKLHQTASRGRTGRDRQYGRLHAAPPFPSADRHESSSVSEEASVACRARTHVHGRPGRRKRGL